MCKQCGNGEVENTVHFVMRWAYVVKDRKRLENLMSVGWKDGMNWGKVKKCFVADALIPHQTSTLTTIVISKPKQQVLCMYIIMNTRQIHCTAILF